MDILYLTYIFAYAKEILPDNSGESLLTCIGVTAAIGKIALGLIADRPNINPVLLQQISFVGIGVITMILTTAPYFNDNAYTVIVIYSLILGVFDGCFSALLGPIAVYICGPENATQGIGFILGVVSMPFMLGPLLAGVLYDAIKSYIVVFLCAGAPPIIGAILLSGIYCAQHSDERNLSINDK